MNSHTLTLFILLVIFIPDIIAAQTSIPPNQLYQEFCSVCHGEKGDGDTHAWQGLQPPPRDFTRLSITQLSREQMLQAVRDGRPGSAMAAWKNKLDESQIAAIVDYVRENFMTGLKQANVDTGNRDAPHPGQIIYAETCSVCHGDNGQGAVWGKDSLNPPPRDFTTEDAKRELSKERMLISVTSGRPGTAMSAYASRLGQNDINAVVDYIRETFLKSEVNNSQVMQSPAASMNHLITTAETKSEQLHTGDITNGKILYLKNCTACHGVSGDGNGPRAYFIFPKPRNFLLPATRVSLDRKGLHKAIEIGVRGKEMPAWGKVLTNQQITDISEYVYQTFINPPQVNSSSNQ